MRVNLLRLVGIERRPCGWYREQEGSGADAAAEPSRNVIRLVQHQGFRNYFSGCSMKRTMEQMFGSTREPVPTIPAEATFSDGRPPMDQVERGRLRRLLTRARK